MGVIRDVDALDVLHDEIRQAVFGRAAIQQARDIGVIERHARCGASGGTATG